MHADIREEVPGNTQGIVVTSWMLPDWLWSQINVRGLKGEEHFRGFGNRQRFFKYMVQRRVDLSNSQDPIVLSLGSPPHWVSERTGFESQVKFSDVFLNVGTVLSTLQSLPCSLSSCMPQRWQAKGGRGGQLA